MGIIASVEITVSEVEFELVIQTLRNAGWTFGNDKIYYEYFKSWDDCGNTLTVPGDSYDILILQLDEHIRNREIVLMSLYWQEPDVRIELSYEQKQANVMLRIHFDGTRPRISNVCKYTDFSWLVLRIVCPLQGAKVNILAVECSDIW